MLRFISKAQVKEAFTRLNERAKRLVWIECDFTIAILVGVALIITDRDLNEVERHSWDISSSGSAVSDEIVSLLATHATQGTCRLAGVGLARQKEALERRLPAVSSFFSSEQLDLGYAGVQGYAQLLGRPLLPESVVKGKVASGKPHTVGQFESAILSCRSPAVSQPPTTSLDRVEGLILSLGWAREHLITPPEAAKYVAYVLNAFGALLIVSVANLALGMMTQQASAV